jgi:hypothetical protein
MRSAFIRSLVGAAAKLAALAALVVAPAAARAQQTNQSEAGRLRLDGLEHLSSKAEEKVEIEIDGALMKFAAALLSDKDPEERDIKEIIAGLKGVYVRSYETKAGAQFTDADLAPLRERLRGPAWTRVVSVKSNDEDEDNSEIYLASGAGGVEGMTILTFEPKELTVINIVGSIDVDKLRKLEGTLGIPRIHTGRKKPAAKQP